MKILSFFFTFSFLFSICFSTSPGFKTTLTQNGINYAKQVGMQLLEEALSTLQIPDQSGDVHPGISWWLTNLKLNGVSLPSSSITIVPGVGLNLQVNGVAATLNFDWRYRQDGWPHIQDSGNGDVSISNSNFACKIHFYDSGGRPAVNVIQTTVTLNGFDVHVNGGPSWLYNLLIGIFEGQIKNAVIQSLQDGITTNVNNGLNKVFAGLPLTVPVSPTVELDYELVEAIEFVSNYFTLFQLGEFYQIGKHVEAPIPRNPIPDELSANMIQLILNEFVPGSAGFVYWKLGQLATNITQKNLPPWAPIHLNTSDWKYVLPNLFAKYPNDAMIISVSTESCPNVQFSPKGATVQVYGFITVYVLTNSGEVTAFVLNGTATASATAKLNKDSLIANLTFLAVNFGLKYSSIGNFDPSVLNSLLNTLFKNGLIPIINEWMKNGFPLPVVPGLTFVNPQLKFGNHYLGVVTDIHYQVPKN